MFVSHSVLEPITTKVTLPYSTKKPNQAQGGREVVTFSHRKMHSLVLRKLYQNLSLGFKTEAALVIIF